MFKRLERPLLYAQLAHLREDSTRLSLIVQMAALDPSGPPFPSPPAEPNIPTDFHVSGCHAFNTARHPHWHSILVFPVPPCPVVPSLLRPHFCRSPCAAGPGPVPCQSPPMYPSRKPGPGTARDPAHFALPLTLSTRVVVCLYLYLLDP